jgi:hypothetical protein
LEAGQKNQDIEKQLHIRGKLESDFMPRESAGHKRSKKTFISSHLRLILGTEIACNI